MTDKPQEYVNFIMANGYAYSFKREKVHPGDKWPSYDGDFLKYVSYVSTQTEGGGTMVINLEQCVAIEFFDESMLPKPTAAPDEEMTKQ